MVTEDKKKREQQESDRLLYVAMTRAKKSVHLLFSNKQLKPGHKSWYATSGCEHWTGVLGKQNRENYIYEMQEFHGPIPQWHVPQNMESQNMKEALQVKTHQNIVRTSVSSLIKDVKTSSPSHIFNKTQLLQKAKKMDLGTSCHKILQALCSQPALIKETPEKLITHYFPYYVQHLSQERQREVMESLKFLLSLKEPPIECLLKQGFSEWPFLYYSEDKIIEGKIDLWGEVDQTIYVVDYKTGRFADQERTLRQLNYYGQALAKQHHKNIKLFAIYLLEQKVSDYDLDV